MNRFDPYKNFKFRVLWDNKPVLGVSKVGSLKRTTEVVKHRSGGENSHDHKSPGRSSFEAITTVSGFGAGPAGGHGPGGAPPSSSSSSSSTSTSTN